MPDKANIQLIKKLNENRVLNLIKEKGPISRNELARQSKISKVAISEIVNRLDEAGYILEIGKGKSTSKGGKRPIMLKLNPDAGFVIGIEIKRSLARIAFANVESTVIASSTIELERGTSTENVISKLIVEIDSTLAESKLNTEKLISIGIGLPGIVDYRKGELLFADTLGGWSNLPIASKFIQYYNVPTIIENDVNIIALGEKLLGAGIGKSDMICLWIGEGVGAGIIVGGQLIHGTNGCAGEIGYLDIGHLLTDQVNIKYLYKNQKIFGDTLSEQNLYRTIMQAKNPDNIEEIKKCDYDCLFELLREAEEDDCICREILDEYAVLVSVLCMNLIKTVNPSSIILNGPVIENSNYLPHKIREIVKERMLKIPFQPSTISIGKLKQEAGIKGAIALALQTIFEPPVKKSRHHANIKYLEN